MTRVGLLRLDVLPGHCAVRSDVQMEDTRIVRVRFRAERPGLIGTERSDWSDWFNYDGEPIALRWDTFWGARGTMSQGDMSPSEMSRLERVAAYLMWCDDSIRTAWAARAYAENVLAVADGTTALADKALTLYRQLDEAER